MEAFMGDLKILDCSWQGACMTSNFTMESLTDIQAPGNKELEFLTLQQPCYNLADPASTQDIPNQILRHRLISLNMRLEVGRSLQLTPSRLKMSNAWLSKA